MDNSSRRRSVSGFDGDEGGQRRRPSGDRARRNGGLSSISDATFSLQLSSLLKADHIRCPKPAIAAFPPSRGQSGPLLLRRDDHPGEGVLPIVLVKCLLDRLHCRLLSYAARGLVTSLRKDKR